MRGKIYSLDDMNRALPLVRAIVRDIVEGCHRLRENLKELGRDGDLPAVDSPYPERELPFDVRDIVDEIREWIDELGEIGIFLRNPDNGLVEAYGEHDGEIVYYSWKPGEDRVRFWHGLFRSARERKPVGALVG